jgi:integrase
MNAARRRTETDPALPGRVYPKSGSWYWFPKGGQWIKLCRIDEGETKMLKRLAAEMEKRGHAEGLGNIPKLVDMYTDANKATHREKRWADYGKPVKEAFADINIEKVDPAYVKEFLNSRWRDKLPMKRMMRTFLNGFFQWCREEGYMAQENPCNGMRMAKPEPRDVYIPNDHFELIRKNIDDPMLLCLVDLCYLTVQRSTEIRNLRWRKTDDKTANWVDRDKGVIHFVPSKTLKSSRVAVDWPISAEIEVVLERARTAGSVKSQYVVHNREGAFWADTAALRVWRRACNAAKLEKYRYTIKDIRAKALTDAQRAGYDMKALRIAAAHTDAKTTEIYFKGREAPLSTIHLQIPKSA